LGDVHFVVHGELDGDVGEVGELAGGDVGFFVMAIIDDDLDVTVHAVDGQDAQGRKVNADEENLERMKHGWHDGMDSLDVSQEFNKAPSAWSQP
jgi:hypothetical protein